MADAADALARANAALSQGNRVAAARALREALAAAPDDAGALALFASVADDLGDAVGASEAFAALARAHPGNTRLAEKAHHAAHKARGAIAARAIGAHLEQLWRSRLLVDGHFQPVDERERAWENDFARLEAELDAAGVILSLALVFDDAEASRQRRNNPWGASEIFGVLPVRLDELTATAMLFLSTALGLSPENGRTIAEALFADRQPVVVNGCAATIEQNGSVTLAVRSAGADVVEHHAGGDG